MKHLGKVIVIAASSTAADENISLCVIQADANFYNWVAACKQLHKVASFTSEGLGLGLQFLEVKAPINLKFYADNDDFTLTNTFTVLDNFDESQFQAQSWSTIGDCLAINNEGLVKLKAFGKHSELDVYETDGFNFEDLE